MPSPSTKLAFKARTQRLVRFLENKMSLLQEEMKKQNIEMYPTRSSIFDLRPADKPEETPEKW